LSVDVNRERWDWEIQAQSEGEGFLLVLDEGTEGAGGIIGEVFEPDRARLAAAAPAMARLLVEVRRKVRLDPRWPIGDAIDRVLQLAGVDT
jgi:hypothetical protein